MTEHIHPETGMAEEHSESHTTPKQHPHHAGKGNHSSRAGRALRIVALLTLGGAVGAAGILPRIKQSNKLKLIAATSKNSTPLVNAIGLTRMQEGDGIALPGSVQAESETVVNARTSGYVRELHADIGVHVKAGQLLALIESPEVDNQLDQAVAESARARAGRQQASADQSRLEASRAQAGSEAVRAQAGIDTALSDLAHSKARLAATQASEAEATARIQQAEKHLIGKKADLNRIVARRDLAKKTVSRWRELEKGGAVSGQELDEAESAYDQAQASVTAAEAEVDSAQADLSAAKAILTARNSDAEAAMADIASSNQRVNAARATLDSNRQQIRAAEAGVRAGVAGVEAATALASAATANTSRFRVLRSFERVVAPFDGVITARNVDIGTLVTPGVMGLLPDPAATVTHNGLFTIAHTNRLRVLVNVPQTTAPEIHEGLAADVTVAELPGKVFHGSVARLSGALDSASRTVMAEVWINGNTGLIQPGTYTQVHFRTGVGHTVLRIPANTLLVDGQGVRVALVTSASLIHYVPVQIGRDLGKEVEIASGLTGTETLVADPGDMLIEGQRVEAIAVK